MKRAHNPLLTLVQTLDDGIEFYRVAEQRTEHSGLKAVFKRMAEVRDFALAYVLPYMDQHDTDLDKSLTYHGTLSNRYAPLLAKVIQDKSLGLVREIEEHLIDAMITASNTCQNALVQCILKDLIPRVSQNYQACEQADALAA